MNVTITEMTFIMTHNEYKLTFKMLEMTLKSENMTFKT